jgi:hypothetical protein
MAPGQLGVNAGELGRRDEVDRGEPRTRTNDHMNIQSVLAACRYEIALLVKSIIRLLWWLLTFALAVSSVYALLHARHVFSIQTSATSTFMLLSLVATFSLAKSQKPDRKTWISVHVCILAAGITAVLWVPQWSGYIVGTALSLFVFTPNLLLQLALRRASAGYDLAAVFYARLAYFFHPSRQFRFASSLRDTQALRSIDQKVANYRRLALQATPEQFALLNCCIPLAQSDWEGVLGQVRSAGVMMSALKWLEIRALGELGQLDEMIAAYGSAASVLPAGDLPFCRLYVLAFSGRTNAVRSLLSRRLRFLAPRMNAYWMLVTSLAAGTHDEDAHRALESCLRASDDETFRKFAKRRMDAGLTPGGVALSAESRATIAAIENTLGG